LCEEIAWGGNNRFVNLMSTHYLTLPALERNRGRA
jgi:hypothetical protein